MVSLDSEVLAQLAAGSNHECRSLILVAIRKLAVHVHIPPIRPEGRVIRLERIKPRYTDNLGILRVKGLLDDSQGVICLPAKERRHGQSLPVDLARNYLGFS